MKVRKSIIKLVIAVAAAAMATGTFPASAAKPGAANQSTFPGVQTVYAAEKPSADDDIRLADIVTGSYKYASVESASGEPLEDSFKYSDRLFAGSSYEKNPHLAVLSSHTAITTGSGYTDGRERDNSGNSANIRELLAGYGFRDIETNAYYTSEEEENSMSCIAGRKLVTVGEKQYTLLAIMPRSAGYLQEWAGNFTVGKNKYHQGIKSARDEILRFTKNYIEKNKIEGNLKIWVTGHSRGGAVANFLGGFFAEGGAGYFSGVTIRPEDVYVYTFATSTCIMNGVTKGDVLSVEGYRGDGGQGYQNDSPGSAYIYSGEDADEVIRPHEGVYRCVKNCAPGYDMITLLPLHSWGYDWYGEELIINNEDSETRERMLNELNRAAPLVYKKYTEENCGELDYVWKTFDFSRLEIVNDETCTESISQSKMFRNKIDGGLGHRAGNPDVYVDRNYQVSLQGIGGLYGLSWTEFYEGALKDPMTLVKAVVFSYFAYAKERLQEENSEVTESQAIAKAVEELIELVIADDDYLTSAEKIIDPATFTVDDFFRLFSKYIVDNAEYTLEPVEQMKSDAESGSEVIENVLDTQVKTLKFKSRPAEEIFESISSAAIGAIPEKYKRLIKVFIPDFRSKEAADSEHNREVVRDFVFSTLNQCAYGDGDKEKPGTDDEAKRVRKTIYRMIRIFMGSGDYKPIIDAMGKTSLRIDGSNNFAVFLNEALKLLMFRKGPSGEIVERYDTVEAAADAFLSEVVGNGVGNILASGRYDEGTPYYNGVIRYGAALQNHITETRKLLLDFLFYEENGDGEPIAFNTERNVRNLCTFAGQANKLALAHYNELYIAWMRAQDTEWADVSELKNAVAAVEKTMENVWVSEDGTDISPAEKYTTAAERKALEDAVQNAMDSAGDPAADQNSVDAQLVSLKAAADTFQTAIKSGKISAGEVRFARHSLLLTGKIGVNFFLDLPKTEDADYSDSFMEFTVNKKTWRVYYNEAFRNEHGAGEYYGFTCYVNSVQMSDRITAVYHYKKDNKDCTAKERYSVETYINSINNIRNSFDMKTLALIDALADYGHYAQPYLADFHGWTIGTDHAAMNTYSTAAYSEDFLKKAKQKLKDYAPRVKSKTADVVKASFSLSLDTGTGIYVYFTLADGGSGTLTARVNGGTKDAERLTDSVVRVSIPDIPAHKLGDSCSVTLTTDSGDTTIDLSPMSYVKKKLTSPKDEKEANAMAALYNYFEKACA